MNLLPKIKFGISVLIVRWIRNRNTWNIFIAQFQIESQIQSILHNLSDSEDNTRDPDNDTNSGNEITQPSLAATGLDPRRILIAGVWHE